MNAETLAEKIGGPNAVEHRSDGLWLAMDELDPREMVRLMLQAEARFVTMTSSPATDGTVALMYHWDIEGTLLTVRTAVTREAISIADILPAADWVERETRDYYALEFSGRSETPTLMLREGDEPGLFSRTDKVGHGCDPAYTAKTGEEVR